MDSNTTNENMPDESQDISQDQKAQKAMDSLREIYDHDEDDKEEMSRLNIEKSSKKRTIMISLLVLFGFLLALSLLSLFLFQRTPKFTGDNVQLSIQTEEEVVSGQEMKILVNFANLETVSFRKAEVEVRYPDGFEFLSAIPEPSKGESFWELGAVPQGQNGEIEITGRIIGEPDSTKTSSVVMSYWPANFSSEFQKVESFETKVGPSPVEVTFSAPDNILVGDARSYTIKYKNTTDREIEDAQLIVEYPESFEFISANPEANIENMIWEIPLLNPEDEGQIVINGNFLAAIEDEPKFRIKLEVKGGDILYTLVEQESPVSLIKSDILLGLIVNGSTSDKPVYFGGRLNYSLTYENNSGTTLKDLQIKLNVASKKQEGTPLKSILDWDNRVDTAEGSVRIDSNLEKTVFDSRTFTWTSDEVDQLAELSDGQKGELTIQIPIKSLPQLEEDSIVDLVGMSVESLMTISVGRVGDTLSDREVTSNKVVNFFNSDLEIGARARYYDDSGAAIGTGPMPPKVGEATRYVIEWDLTNSIHEVQDITVNAELPDNVKWANSYSVTAGDIRYDEASNVITWTVNRFPISVNTLSAQFEIAFTPASGSQGQVVTVLDKTVLTAKDTVTNGKIAKVEKILTTALEGDQFALDKGVVVE